MVLVTMNKTYEDFLKQKEDKRLDYASYFLLEKQINEKKLKIENIDSDKVLSSYIEKLSMYPSVYKGPLYCYLFNESDFVKLNLLPDKYSNCGSVFSIAKDDNYYQINNGAIIRFGDNFNRLDYRDSKNYVERKMRSLLSHYNNKNSDELYSHVVLNWE